LIHLSTSSAGVNAVVTWILALLKFWGKFRRNRAAMLGLCLITLLAIGAICAPIIAPYNPIAPHYADRLSPPNGLYLFGTDELGRDLFSRLLYGGRISLVIGFAVQGVATAIGTTLGLIAGWYGGWRDDLIMRLAEIVFAVPNLVFLIVWVTLLQPTPISIFLGLGLISWPGSARMMRAQVLVIKQQDYIMAARSLGGAVPHILWHHVLPNAITPILVLFWLGIGSTILTESALSFLGLGITIPTPSWGVMIDVGRSYMTTAWWYAVFPGLTILLTVLGFNFIGEGLREALNPASGH